MALRNRNQLVQPTEASLAALQDPTKLLALGQVRGIQNMDAAKQGQGASLTNRFADDSKPKPRPSYRACCATHAGSLRPGDKVPGTCMVARGARFLEAFTSPLLQFALFWICLLDQSLIRNFVRGRAFCARGGNI